MDLGIKGRIALISGADSGMGKETARLLQYFGCETRIFDPRGLPLPERIAGFGLSEAMLSPARLRGSGS